MRHRRAVRAQAEAIADLQRAARELRGDLNDVETALVDLDTLSSAWRSLESRVDDDVRSLESRVDDLEVN